jgi:short-subunit dehydrogenase
MVELRDKVVVITGGTAGVGRALSRAFAQEKCKVAILARGETKLERTFAELAPFSEVDIFQVDVADYEQVEDAAREIEKKWGPIDIWINNAMASVFSPIKETSPQEIKRVTEVTYLGSVNGVLVSLKSMLPRNKGQILQIGSALSYQSIPLQAAYCAAKHAVHGFLQSLRIELKHDRSRVMVSELQLPAVNTPQFEWTDNHMGEHPMPVPPIFQPEVIARAAVYLAKNPRREIWLGLPTVKAVIASKILPRVAEWYLSRKGYQSQLTKELPAKKDNDLWNPVAKDYGAHGSFDNEAKKISWQFEIYKRRKLFAASSLLIPAAMLLKRKISEPRLNP